MASHKFTVETNTSVVKYEHEWKVNNFLKYYDVLRGAEFFPLKSIPLKFVLELEPRLKRTDDYWGYNLNLIKLSKDEISKTCRVEISVTIYNGPTFANTVPAISTVGAPCTVYNIESMNLFNGSLYKNNYLYIDDTGINADTEYLSFLCTFTFFGYNVTTVWKTDPILQAPDNRHINVCCDFKTLYESKINSDISFEIGKDTLKAHQCILVARSAVFKRMLENNLAESNSKCIQITDFNLRVFDCFLKYLYCGDLDDTSFDIVTDLFALADKYSVTDLMTNCGEILANSLTVETVCRVVVLSYLHSHESLKNKSMQFINHYFSVLKKKPEWTRFTEDYPKLTSEIFSMMSSDFE